MLVWAGSCPTNHTRGAQGAAFTGAGGKSTLSSEDIHGETHCSSRSALTEGTQPLPVPLRGGAWAEAPRNTLALRRGQATFPLRLSTQTLRSHSAAPGDPIPPVCTDSGRQTATFSQSPTSVSNALAGVRTHALGAHKAASSLQIRCKFPLKARLQHLNGKNKCLSSFTGN